MTFKEFKEMLVRLRESGPATAADVAAPEVAVVNMRDAVRSETLSLSIKLDDLVDVLCLCAGEPLRKWSSFSLEVDHPVSYGCSRIYGSRGQILKMTIGTSEGTKSVTYRKEEE